MAAKSEISHYEKYGQQAQFVTLDPENDAFIRITKRKLGITFNRIINSALADFAKKGFQIPKVPSEKLLDPYLEEISESLLSKPMSKKQLKIYLRKKLLDYSVDLSQPQIEPHSRKEKTA